MQIASFRTSIGLVAVLLAACTASVPGDADPDAKQGSRLSVPPVAGTVVQMEAADFSFDPATVEVAAGEPVSIEIAVESGLHTFVIDELGVRAELDSGVEVVSFTPTVSGSYIYYCDVPGHREQGMEGTLVVQ